MTTKVFRFLGIDTAMHLLRPGAKWDDPQYIINNLPWRYNEKESQTT